MEAVKEWLRGLVLLVILASLLELLLPMGSMKRFVRMTMGLLIILGVVQPIVALLGQQVTLEPTMLMADEPRLPSLDQIMVEADRFQARNEEILVREAESRLGEELRGAVRRVDGVNDARVEVELAAGKGADDYRVEGVKVTMNLGSRFGQVRPVEPVGRPAAGIAADEPGLSAEELRLTEAVRREVIDHLGLTDGRLVQVVINRGGAPRR